MYILEVFIASKRSLHGTSQNLKILYLHSNICFCFIYIVAILWELGFGENFCCFTTENSACVLLLLLKSIEIDLTEKFVYRRKREKISYTNDISIHETEEIGLLEDPSWVRILSNHWRGPSKWISIQHGVEVTSRRWYSLPHPLTKDNLK